MVLKLLKIAKLQLQLFLSAVTREFFENKKRVSKKILVTQVFQIWLK
jgi:hypothetical protein